MSAEVFILITDDHDDGHELFLRELRRIGGVRAEFRLPDEITSEDLQAVHLLLVDFDIGDWEGADPGGPIARAIPDGLALAACLRRTLLRQPHWPPTAVALYTAELLTLARPLAASDREHLIARANGLDWVFSKSEVHRAGQAVALAKAVAALPERWPDTENEQVAEVLRLLGVPDGTRCGASVEESVARARPPTGDLGVWSAGLSVPRWLLHRVLPYPTFLVDAATLACRLRCRPELLDQLVEDGRDPLAAARYDGVLADFLGPRWWRPAVDQMLWDGTDGQGFDADAVLNWLATEVGSVPELLSEADPVVLSEGGGLSRQIADSADVERHHVDEWPDFADPPWRLRHDASGKTK